MKAQTIGRVLGIGLRVAGRVAGQRMAGESHPAAPRAAGSASVSAADHRTRGQAAGRATVQVGKGVRRGVGGFFGPFRRVGGILWLEVTGFFFLLFALIFGWYMWQNWSAHTNPDATRNVALSGIFMVLFLYLGVSSFWRASRR